MKRYSKKLISIAIVGLLLSQGTSALAATSDQLYLNAYNLTKVAISTGIQADINEARNAIDALKGTGAEWAIGQFSQQVDGVQQPILVKIISAINKAKSNPCQANINIAKASIPNVLTPEWKNSYSSALDSIEQGLINDAVNAYNTAESSKSSIDITTAMNKINDIVTSTDSSISKWAYNYAITKVDVLATANGITPIIPSIPLTVSSVSSINDSKNVGDIYTLPTTVTATLSDGTTKVLTVTWDKIPNTQVAGTYTFAGILSMVDGIVNPDDVTVKAILNVVEIPKIGTPIGSILCPSGLGFYTNSADGIKVYWLAKNQTGKTINYYIVNISMYNRVGDPAYDEINNNSKISAKYVGPVLPNELLGVYSIVAYTPVCSKIVIDSIYLQYSDGTYETVSYGYSGTETLSK